MLAVLLCASLPLAASQTQREACPGFVVVPYQGPSCPVEGGWRVFLSDGSTIFTHGPDPVAADLVAAGPYPTETPACTTDGSLHHTQLIYAHPSDKPDRSASLKQDLRDQVDRANGQVHQEALLFDDDMVLRFRCDPNGQVNVAVEHLSFPHSSADFSRISGELRSRGYDAPNAKYLVFYDANNGGGIGGGIAGQGSVHMDDRLVPNNNNLVGGDFAINYGYTGVTGAHISLHEMGHNQGAVQLTAPHTSGAWHCNDGLDTMCYSDGGMNASYTTSRCSQTAWDCGHDTYFHPAPPGGSYLASHWNLGSRYNKYLEFGSRPNQAPTVVSLTCTPSATMVNSNVTCSTWAFDPDDDPAFGAPGRKLNLTIDWGDGTQTGPTMIESGRALSAKHAWTEVANYTIRVTATDNGVPPLTSAPLTRVHSVGCYYRAPTSSNLILGLGGLAVRDPVTHRDHNIPTAACQGKPYTLSGNSPNDFDVCWYQGDVELRCDRGFGGQTGTVPMGADRARVILTLGANGNYVLILGGTA